MSSETILTISPSKIRELKLSMLYKAIFVSNIPKKRTNKKRSEFNALFFLTHLKYILFLKRRNSGICVSKNINLWINEMLTIHIEQFKSYISYNLPFSQSKYHITRIMLFIKYVLDKRVKHNSFSFFLFSLWAIVWILLNSKTSISILQRNVILYCVSLSLTN